MVDGLFFGHFFWKVRRAVCIHGSNMWRGHLRVGGIYVWEAFMCGRHLRVEGHLRV